MLPAQSRGSQVLPGRSRVVPSAPRPVPRGPKCYQAGPEWSPVLPARLRGVPSVPKPVPKKKKIKKKIKKIFFFRSVPERLRGPPSHPEWSQILQICPKWSQIGSRVLQIDLGMVPSDEVMFFRPGAIFGGVFSESHDLRGTLKL